jgi:hypothetical protein
MHDPTNGLRGTFLPCTTVNEDKKWSEGLGRPRTEKGDLVIY